MSDNRKYYYLKLKENYFDDDSIVLLESMQDGVLYSNILLKLYLKSLKHGGRLQLDEDIEEKKDSMSQVLSDIKPHMTKKFMTAHCINEQDIQSISPIFLPRYKNV